MIQINSLDRFVKCPTCQSDNVIFDTSVEISFTLIGNEIDFIVDSDRALAFRLQEGNLAVKGHCLDCKTKFSAKLEKQNINFYSAE